MSGKVEAAMGAITFSVLGITATLTPEDVANWNTVLMGAMPLLLIIFLIWRMRKLDQQHKDCTENNARMQDQIILAYRALQSVQVRKNLPPEEEFVSGKFDLTNHPSQER